MLPAYSPSGHGCTSWCQRLPMGLLLSFPGGKDTPPLEHLEAPWGFCIWAALTHCFPNCGQALERRGSAHTAATPFALCQSTSALLSCYHFFFSFPGIWMKCQVSSRTGFQERSQASITYCNIHQWEKFFIFKQPLIL